jgi:hypothetical protein
MPSVPLWVWVLVIGASALAAVGTVGGIHLAVRRNQVSLASAGLVTAWLVSSLILASQEVFRARESGLPSIVFAVAGPIVLGLTLFRFWPAVRRLVDAIPRAWLLAAQAPRVFGVTFLVLLARDELPGIFAHPAGYGDILVGVAAPVVAYLYAARTSWSLPLAIGFNVVGIADLMVAVGTGFLSAPSPFRLFFTEPSTEIMTVLPMAMIPVFLVPLFILIHLASLQQLAQEARGRPSKARIGLEARASWRLDDGEGGRT